MTTEVQAELDIVLDETLLDMIKNRVPMRNHKGEPCFDKDDNIIRVYPPAAILQAARGRLKDLGIGRLPGVNDPLRDIDHEMELRKRDPEDEFDKLHAETLKPDFTMADDEEDDPATAVG